MLPPKNALFIQPSDNYLNAYGGRGYPRCLGLGNKTPRISELIQLTGPWVSLATDKKMNELTSASGKCYKDDRKGW